MSQENRWITLLRVRVKIPYMDNRRDPNSQDLATKEPDLIETPVSITSLPGKNRELNSFSVSLHLPPEEHHHLD